MNRNFGIAARAAVNAGRTLAACAAAALALVALPVAHAGDRDRGGHGDDFQIETLSSPPHLVSGGSALVRVDVPRFVRLSHVRVTVNGADVTASFHADQDGDSLTGLVTHLRNG